MPSYTPDEALIQEDSQSSSPSSNSVKGIAAGKKGKKNKARKTKVDTEVREHTEEPSPEPPEMCVNTVFHRRADALTLNRTPQSPQLLTEQPSPFANYHSFDPPSDPGSTGNDTLLPPLSPQTKPRDPDPETIESFPNAVPVPTRATPQNYGANITPNYSSPASYGSYRHASAYASPSQGAPQRFPPSASPLEGDFRRIQNHMGPPQGRDRSSSMTSKSSHPPRFYEPPPPHMPQRHFSRVSDLSFGLLKDAEDTASPGSNGYFCGFDSLDTANAAVPATANNIILAGSSGGVDIYKMLRQRVEIAGRLEGLHGSVLDAKVLPWTDRHDPYEALRPLVVLVVHGPLQNRGLDCADGLRDADSPSNVTEFQTTVQVFSLKTSKHVSTLYTSAPVTVEHPIGHPLFSGPPVSLSRLQVSAEGKYIAVASGETGEVFIFTPSTTADFTGDPSFLCVGKFWTSVKERLNRPGSSSETRDDQKDGTQGHSSKPIYSLSSRWLAIVPPPVPRRRFSTNGTVSQPDHNLVAPGTSSLMSPAPPVPNCATDLPKSDRLIDWMTKQAAQDFRKGANWVGGYVQQSWNSYRSGPSAPQVTDGQYSNRKISAGDAQSAFPPTHAHINEPDPTANEPSLVSVLDLQKLLEYAEGRVKNPLAPLATFQLPDGCSFLSFAPNGLSLLTTNHTGDLSVVWNLMRMNDSKAAHVAASDSSLEQCVGMVQTIARFPRISPSVVVDVAWTDENDRLAILTDKGTVHLHELPTTEFRLEAPHSPAVRPTSRAEYSSPGTSPQPEVPTNGWMSNVRAGINGLHSQFAAARSRSGTNGFALPTLSTLGTASAAARHAGGRVVRNGIHRGFDMAAEGAHHIRHAEDNKIRLRPSSQEVGPARHICRWEELTFSSASSPYSAKLQTSALETPALWLHGTSRF
ncbi:hypothetical protein M8818_006264 [Zalaria obscura]|uniref:Uncharacterized protein n=1 Tax=Zalaria obscura TaxID=2024903 RepID=A0ACC3S810_9PEZI